MIATGVVEGSERVRIHRSLVVLKGNRIWWFGAVLMSLA